MYFLPNERVALFIDGANLYSASRNLGFDVDYRNLLQYFRKQANIIRAYYYSAVLETEEYSPLKPLTDWLAYNGYSLVTKPAKEFTDATGRRRVKGNMDIEVAVDMLELAPKIDHAVLVQRRQRFPPSRRGGPAQGRPRLGGQSSIRTSPPMVADDLRRQADDFVELSDIAAEFTRRQTEPRVRPPMTLRQTPADPFSRRGVHRRGVSCVRRPRAAKARARLPALSRAWSPFARRAAPPSLRGITRPSPASARSTRAFWSSEWPPACKRRQPHGATVHRRFRRDFCCIAP